jgi:vacuolar-type H+-ATPase subunit E/Vma4
LPPVKAIVPVTLLALCSCQSPADVAVRFHQALSVRDGKRALGMLSASTRAELERRAREASQRCGGALAADAAEMISQGDLSIYPAPGPSGAAPAASRLLDQDETKARVELTIGETRGEVALVRETGGWRLDLPLNPRLSAP